MIPQKTNQSIVKEEIYSKIPKLHFEWRIEQTKFNRLVELIIEGKIEEINKFLQSNTFRWKELCIYVCCILSKKDLLIKLKDEMENYTKFLEMSCLAANIELAKFFIESCEKRFPNSLLCCAAQSGSIEMVEYLALLGLKNWNAALSYACKCGDKNLAEYFMLKGANNFSSAFSFACMSGKMDVVQLFASKDLFDWNDYLLSACKSGNIEIVKLIISKGADNWNGALSSACISKNIDVVKLIIEKGADNFVKRKFIFFFFLIFFFIYFN